MKRAEEAPAEALSSRINGVGRNEFRRCQEAAGEGKGAVDAAWRDNDSLAAVRGEDQAFGQPGADLAELERHVFNLTIDIQVLLGRRPHAPYLGAAFDRD